MPPSGPGTHRDSHKVEIADSAGEPVAAIRIGNDGGGFPRFQVKPY
jgi:hypothetical protein